MINFQTNTRHRTPNLPLPGNKIFSLVLWKHAVEILKQHPKVSAYVVACMLSCTEKTAEGMLADYRTLKSRYRKKEKRRKSS